MSGIGFDLQLVAAPAALDELDEERCDDLCDAVAEVIHGYLEEALTYEEEVATWEGIDGAVLAEIEPDALKAGKLSFVFHDHWILGAEAAWHFYRHAVAARWDALNDVLREARLELAPPRLTRADVTRFEDGERILARAKGELWLVEPDGSFIAEEDQEPPPEDDEEAQAALVLAKDRQCGCELCEHSAE